MPKYFLSNKAVDDLSKIWDYTYEVWSEKQADKYYYELLEDCQEISKNHSIGRNYIDIDIEIYGYKSGQHIIFYRTLNETDIEIVRLLHSRMDLKNRLEE
jgi:toxin ParE1/3/4